MSDFARLTARRFNRYSGIVSGWTRTGKPSTGSLPVSKIKPCLWFDNMAAEEAANFYVTLLPDSRVNNVARAAADTPSGPAGMVLTVSFTLAGQDFQGLNGGPDFTFNEAISFSID